MKYIVWLLVVLVIGVASFVAYRMMKSANSRGGASELPPEVTKKVKRDRAAREAVRKQNPELFASVSSAMFRRDPIGINFGNNTDEYEAEAGTVIPRLRECSSKEDVTRVLHEEFTHWFTAEVAGKQANYDALADDIWKLWNDANIDPKAAATRPSD